MGRFGRDEKRHGTERSAADRSESYKCSVVSVLVAFSRHRRSHHTLFSVNRAIRKALDSAILHGQVLADMLK
jgi:hypothetical protein